MNEITIRIIKARLLGDKREGNIAQFAKGETVFGIELSGDYDKTYAWNLAVPTNEGFCWAEPSGYKLLDSNYEVLMVGIVDIKEDIKLWRHQMRKLKKARKWLERKLSSKYGFYNIKDYQKPELNNWVAP